MAKKTNYSEQIINMLNMENVEKRIREMMLYPAIIIGGISKEGKETVEFMCSHCGHTWSETYISKYTRYGRALTCPVCKKKMAEGRKVDAGNDIGTNLELWDGVSLKNYHRIFVVEAAELNGSKGLVIARLDVRVVFHVEETIKTVNIDFKRECYGFVSEDYKYLFNSMDAKTTKMLSNAFTDWSTYVMQSDEAIQRIPFLCWMKKYASFEEMRWLSSFDQYWDKKRTEGCKSLGEAHAEQTLGKYKIPDIPKIKIDKQGLVPTELSLDIMTNEYKMEYFCTECKHIFYRTTRYSREETTCPNCGLVAGYNMFQSARESSTVAVITVLENNVVFIRTGVFTRVLDKKYNESYERNESYRVFLDLGSEKEDFHFLVLEGYAHNAVWKEKKNYSSNKFYCCVNQVEFVGDVTALKYSGLQEYITRNMEKNYGGTISLCKIIHYLRYWKRFPVMEQLCKRGFISTIERELDYRYDKDEMLAIGFEEQKITDAVRIPERLIKHYLKSGDEYSRLVKYQNLYRMDPNVREEDLEWLDENGVDEMQVKGVLDESRMSIMRLCEYLEHVRINQCFEPKYAISDWRDYLKAAKTIEVDLTDNKARYPSSLKREHDRAVAKQKLVLDAKKDEFFQAETERYGRLYSYKTDEYMIVPPKDMKDLFEEGRKLNHCVGSYSDRIIAGETCIMFIRKASEPKKPYFTIEISQRNSYVVQLRANSNRCINRSTEKELVKFLKEWSKKKKVALNGAA